MTRRPGGWWKREQGIALVAVLWTMLLLGIIAASFLRETRVETSLARNLTERAKAEMLAEAGVQRAMLGLLDPNEGTVWRADGTMHEFRLGDGVVRLRVQDEAGKIDLNHAPRELLIALFVHLGLSADEAAALAGAIAAFRGSVGEGQPDATDDMPTRPQDDARAGFERVEELPQVVGMSRDFYELVAPNVTVYSGSPDVDPASAQPLVLQVLQEVSPERYEDMAPTQIETATAPSRPMTVTVSADAFTADGGAFGRDVVLRRTDDITRPFQILAWRQRWRTMP